MSTPNIDTLNVRMGSLTGRSLADGAGWEQPAEPDPVEGGGVGTSNLHSFRVSRKSLPISPLRHQGSLNVSLPL